ncbi:magnesium transporter NIPA9 [Spatholobus suberectus]|nr:magnesium transporter NIPA9 [Spatholobus suberectus]
MVGGAVVAMIGGAVDSGGKAVEVSAIQTISGCGLAILSMFSHFYLKEVVNAIDWVGITLVGFGTIGVGARSEEQEVVALSIFHIPGLALLFSSCL